MLMTGASPSKYLLHLNGKDYSLKGEMPSRERKTSYSLCSPSAIVEQNMRFEGTAAQGFCDIFHPDFGLILFISLAAQAEGCIIAAYF